MKSVFTFLGISVIVSGLLLFYIYQQVCTIQCSYRIQAKEKELADFADAYKQMSYELNTLYAPTWLEEKLSLSQVDLVAPTDIKLIHNRLPTSPVFFAQSRASKGFHILNGIELVAEAHADSSQQ